MLERSVLRIAGFHKDPEAWRPMGPPARLTTFSRGRTTTYRGEKS